MFDIGWIELLLVAFAALIIVGPRDLPRLLRRMGQLAGSVRRQAQDFRQALEEMDQPHRPSAPPYLPAESLSPSPSPSPSPSRSPRARAKTAPSQKPAKKPAKKPAPSKRVKKTAPSASVKKITSSESR